MNGLAEAFNKTICKILKKVVSRNRREWSERLPEALWAYCTIVKGPTHATPFSLVYGTEAVLPVEIQLPSLRIAMNTQLTEEEKDLLRVRELDSLDETQLEARQNIELYQARISASFDKVVRQRSLKKGDLVLVVRKPMKTTFKSTGKFKAKWEGPYVVDTVNTNGAYHLRDVDGVRQELPINGKFLKKYYQ